MATALASGDAVVGADESEIAASSTSADDLPDTGADSAVESALENLEIPAATVTSAESASSEESPSEATTANTTTSTSSPLEASSAASSSGSSPPSAPTTADESSEKSEATPPPSQGANDNGDHDASVAAAASSPPTVETAAAATSSANDDDDDDQSVYQIKWTKFHSTETLAIVTQNENGPCPLLAIVNVLLLRGKLKISAGTSIITYSQLMALLWDCILTQVSAALNVLYFVRRWEPASTNCN